MYFSDGIQWHFLINKIGEIFTILVITELLISRCSLASNWNKFSHILKTQNVKDYYIDIHNEKFEVLIAAVNSITTKLMNDDIVQNSLNNLLLLRKKDLLAKNCSLVSAEFMQYIRHAILNLDKLAQDKPNSETMYKCIKINTLFVLTSYLFGNNEKKVFKSLMELNTKVNIFVCKYNYYISRRLQTIIFK